jgi:hypothetical protein
MPKIEYLLLIVFLIQRIIKWLKIQHAYLQFTYHTYLFIVAL